MAVFLVPVEEGRPIVLDKAIVLIGRQANCDVVLTQSRRVSRRHCCVAQVDDRFVVRDLGSMNGVRVNGKRIDRETEIRLGDVLSIGDLGFVLQSRDVIPPRDRAKQRADETVREPDDDAPRQTKRAREDLSRDFPVVISDARATYADDMDEPAQGGRESFPEPRPDPSCDASDEVDDFDSDGDSHQSSEYQGKSSHFELLPD